jgi:hypothetical protein
MEAIPPAINENKIIPPRRVHTPLAMEKIKPMGPDERAGGRVSSSRGFTKSVPGLGRRFIISAVLSPD